jgi:hypothetical protein
VREVCRTRAPPPQTTRNRPQPAAQCRGTGSSQMCGRPRLEASRPAPRPAPQTCPLQIWPGTCVCECVCVCVFACASILARVCVWGGGGGGRAKEGGKMEGRTHMHGNNTAAAACQSPVRQRGALNRDRPHMPIRHPLPEDAMVVSRAVHAKYYSNHPAEPRAARLPVDAGNLLAEQQQEADARQLPELLRQLLPGAAARRAAALLRQSLSALPGCRGVVGAARRTRVR